VAGPDRLPQRTGRGRFARRFLSGAIALVLWPLMAAAAERPQPEPPPEANVISVRPSSFDDRSVEARLAEERLERRLKRSDQALRSICVGCGSRDAVPGAGPFSPMDALHPSANAPSQMLLNHPLPDQVIVETRQVPVDAPEQPSAPTAGNPP
jgi:hypothetical protein